MGMTPEHFHTIPTSSLSPRLSPQKNGGGEERAW